VNLLSLDDPVHLSHAPGTWKYHEEPIDENKGDANLFSFKLLLFQVCRGDEA